MLKKFFHPVLVVSLLAMGLVAAACSDSNDDGPKSVELTGETSTEQTVYADETQKPENITFKAAAPWTATVTDTTPVQTKAETGNTEWLKLDHYSGEAGDVSLTMTLSLNLTGHDRKAEIRIVCGDTTIVITVEQKATKADGTQPEQSDLKNQIKRIEGYRYNETGGLGPIDEYFEFKYDEIGRVIGIKRFLSDPIYDDTKFNITVTYGDKTIVYEIVGKEEACNWTCTDTAVLDENGRVVSDKITGVAKHDDGETHPYEISFCFTYDANGYLVKTKQTDRDPNEYLDEITWTDGNPTQRVGYRRNDNENKPAIDRATYGTIENKANLDLNWLIALGTEGWRFTVGDNLFPAATGYMGKRSKYMAETVTRTDEYDHYYSYINQYQFDEEGRIAKIIETTDDGTPDFEYIIIYEK